MGAQPPLVAAAPRLAVPSVSPEKREGAPTPPSAPAPLLHHRAATRLAVGTLPVLICITALVLLDALALWQPRDVGAAATTHLLLPGHLFVLSGALLLEVYTLVALHVGGPTATTHVAAVAAAFFIVPSAVAARDAVLLAPRQFCAAAPTPTACADAFLLSLLLPLGASFFLLSGLPPRFAFSLELARLGGVCAMVFSICHGAPSGLPAAWAAKFALKCLCSAFATPVLLRAALGPDEPRELAQLHLCPAALRPARDLLMAIGARLARVPGLEAVPPALLALQFVGFCASFGHVLLKERGAATATAIGRHLTMAAWAGAFGAVVAHAARLHARRAARHTWAPTDRRVHALHLRLSTLDASVDAEASLATAALELLAAFPPGCSVALAEWTTNDPGGGFDERAAQHHAADKAAAGAHASKPVAAVSRRVFLQRVLARSPRPAAEEAMRGAVRRGCARRGSAAAALAKPGAAAGLTLDSEDFAEGAGAFGDWAALVSDTGAGPGNVSLSLVGSGTSVVGGLWVHAPAGVHAPAPAAVREYADCIAAVLLRNRAHRAALRAAAADARADADATLALQRSFLSGITHELRTPLNAVVGFTSTVLEGAQLTPTDAEYLRCSMTAANTLLSIIDQLLDYSKWARQAEGGSASKQPLGALAVAPLRVSTILDELVDVVGGRAAGKGVALRVEACAAVQAALLRGDAPRLRQVLINLSDNAIKFTRCGGAVAVVAAACDAPRRDSAVCISPLDADDILRRGSLDAPADGEASADTEACGAATVDALLAPPPQWLRITVSDNGVGVPPDQQWRLFRPFSQVPQNTAPGVKPVGSGLGLVISRAIVREMGGDITFTSLPGVGTTFTIVAPFQRDADAATPAAFEQAHALAGAVVLPLLRDTSMGNMLARMGATWGAKAVLPPPGSMPHEAGAAFESVALRTAVDAASAARASPDAPLILLVDAGGLVALRRMDAPPLPHAACCVLAATPAEQAVWVRAAATARGVTPPDLLLDLPTSPGRLFARLRAAAAFTAAPLGEVSAGGAHSAALRAPDAAPSPPPSPVCSDLRVLLAEDNAMNAAVARAVLARCGVKAPRIVGDGELAVAAFRESLAPGAPPWSLILLDMQMPRMDGPSAARAIRALEAELFWGPAPRGRIRVVAVTANSAEEDRRECIAAGMDEVMIKPVTPAAMRDVLARVADAA